MSLKLTEVPPSVVSGGSQSGIQYENVEILPEEHERGLHDPMLESVFVPLNGEAYGVHGTRREHEGRGYDDGGAPNGCFWGVSSIRTE